MRLNRFLLLFSITCTTSLQGALIAHEWKDKSGHYRVEAEMVTANKELVILRTADHRLIAIDLVQLSEADQALVHSKMENSNESLEPAKRTTLLRHCLTQLRLENYRQNNWRKAPQRRPVQKRVWNNRVWGLWNGF